ncbi:MAG: putative binding protein [Bacteroidetes bacterium]|nr:putative binding protein [Bacteroidota bacterium]
MPAQIITTDDLREFKMELLEEITKLFENRGENKVKKWLKSSEVRKLLNVSPGTLQTLRVNGTLPSTKIGGTHYFNFNDIEKLLSQKRP